MARRGVLAHRPRRRGTPRGKLTGAQDNDATSWLPSSAESTQVWEESKEFRPEVITAIVVYARADGLTAADRTRIAADRKQLLTLRAHGVRGEETRGPLYDRRTTPAAAQIFVPITMDEKGWERIGPAVDSVRDVVGDGGEGSPSTSPAPAGSRPTPRTPSRASTRPCSSPHSRW